MKNFTRAVALLLLCSSSSAFAIPILVNGGAEFGDLTGWTLTPAGAPASAVMNRSQFSGTVGPFEGDWFFTFANAPHPGPIVLTQTGTAGLGAPGLVLDGWFQTEFGDPAEVVLSILDGVNDVLASVTTGPVTTSNLKWEALPTLAVSVPAGAAAWMVELRGDLNFSTFVNTHFDGIRLVVGVPEPATLGLLGAGLLGLGVMRRRRAA